MRDKLSDIIQTVVSGYDKYWADAVAEGLLNEGVIVPPVKVGQTVYIPWKWEGITGIATPIVECVRLVENEDLCSFFVDMESDDSAFNDIYGGWKNFDTIGKKIFVSRSEAEKISMELKGLKPCPFCGGTAYTKQDSITYTVPAKVLEEVAEQYWVVRCEKCALKYPVWHYPKTEQEAIDIWNRRADDDT